MMKTISHNSSYRVGDQPIRLRIRIGDEQFGSSRVIVGQRVFPQVREFSEELGLGGALAGQTIIAASIVTDIKDNTNQTSVTYELAGGPGGASVHTSTFTVERENDSVQFVAQIVLVP